MKEADDRRLTPSTKGKRWNTSVSQSKNTINTQFLRNKWHFYKFHYYTKIT